MVPGIESFVQITINYDYNLVWKGISFLAGATLIYQIAVSSFDSTKLKQTAIVFSLELCLVSVLFSSTIPSESKVVLFVVANTIFHIVKIILPISSKGSMKPPGFLKEMVLEKEPLPMVGNEDLIETLTNMMNLEKPNVIILGLPGTGKSKLVHHIVQLTGKTDSSWYKKRIFFLDHGEFTGGTKFHGEWQLKVKELLYFTETNPDVFVFIDEIHVIMSHGAGKGSSSRAADLLKPAVDAGRIRIIGATTETEFASIAKDKAFESRFQKVWVKEPDDETCMEILSNQAQKTYPLLKFSDENLNFILTCSKQLSAGVVGNPRKALELMKAVVIHKKKDEEITQDLIKKVFDQSSALEKTQQPSTSAPLAQGQQQTELQLVTYIQMVFSKVLQGLLSQQTSVERV